MLNLPIPSSLSLVSQLEPTTLLQITVTLKADLRLMKLISVAVNLFFFPTLRPFKQCLLNATIYDCCTLCLVGNKCFIKSFTISLISRYCQQ